MLRSMGSRVRVWVGAAAVLVLGWGAGCSGEAPVITGCEAADGQGRERQGVRRVALASQELGPCCAGCHAVDSDEVKTGPSLKGIGSRMEKWEILDAIVNPDATLAEGYDPGLMEGALAARDFYSRMSGKDYQAFVDWLSNK